MKMTWVEVALLVVLIAIAVLVAIQLGNSPFGPE